MMKTRVHHLMQVCDGAAASTTYSGTMTLPDQASSIPKHCFVPVQVLPVCTRMVRPVLCSSMCAGHQANGQR